MNYTRRQFNRTALVATAGYALLGTSLALAGTNLYTVRKNDTLSHIALRFDISVQELKQANGLKNDLIKVGQRLRIPGQSTLAKEAPDMLTNVRAVNASIPVRTGTWKRIVVHHSAIKYGNAKKYDRAHRERGMSNGLAYHFVIGNGIDSGDGEIEVGSRWKKQLQGGHVKKHAVNLNSIGICLVGNFEETQPSKRQMHAFTQLADWLQRDVLKKKTLFAGHREIKGEQTVCPGKKFPLAEMHARYG